MNNLKQLGMGMHMYANDHDGKFPPDIQAVVKAGTINAQVLVSPLPRLPVSISYNSKSERESVFGWGWNAGNR